MSRLFVGGVAAAALLGSITQAAAAVLTAKDCIQEALKHSPALAQNSHQIEADRADITKKRGTQLPYLSSELQGYVVNGSPVSEWTSLNVLPPEEGIPQATTAANLNKSRNKPPSIHWAPVSTQQIGITYPLVSEGSIMGLNDPPPVATATATLTQAQLNRTVAEQKVIFDVLTQYVYATGFRQQLEGAEELVRLNESQDRITQQEVKSHAIAAYQQGISDAELKAAQDSARAIRMNEEAALVQLAVLMGRGSDSNVEVDPMPPPLSELQPVRELLDKVMASHPALRVQQAAVEIARQQLRADQGSQWPTVTLNTNFMAGEDLEHISPGGSRVRPTSFLSYLTIDIPIWDFGQRHAAKLESEALLNVQQDQLAALRVDLRTSMTQAYNDILQDAQITAGLKSTYYKDLAAAELAEAQRKQGSATELALVTARITAANSLLAVQQEEMAERLKYVELQNLSGGTWQWLQ